MFEMFKKQVVRADKLSNSNPDRVAEFVAAAKKPQPPKGIEMVNGRPVYSATPVMAPGERSQLDKADIEKNLEHPEELLKGGFQDSTYEKIKGNITRAGYHDLDEKVKTVVVKPLVEAGDSGSGFSDSTREALSLAEQKERYTSLSEQVRILEAELEGVPVGEPLAWKEKNDALKPMRAELQFLRKLLTDSAKMNQPN